MDIPKADEIYEGELSCRKCGKEYRISNGVLYFLGRNTEVEGFSFENEVEQRRYIERIMENAAAESATLGERDSAERMQRATRERYELERYSGTWLVPDDVISRLNGYENGLVVEGACGPGECLIGLRKMIGGKFFLGVDISSRMVRDAQRTAMELNGAENGNVLFVEGDIRYLPIRSNSCSVYVVNNAWDRVAEPRRAAKEARRILNGLGSVVFSNCQPMQFECIKDGKRIVYVPEDERMDIEKAVRVSGCELILVKEGDIWAIRTLYDGEEMLPMKVVYGIRRLENE